MTALTILSLLAVIAALVSTVSALRMQVKRLIRERDDLLAERDRYFWAVVSRSQPAEDAQEVTP